MMAANVRKSRWHPGAVAGYTRPKGVPSGIAFCTRSDRQPGNGQPAPIHMPQSETRFSASIGNRQDILQHLSMA
jgi:hypothetical protein